MGKVKVSRRQFLQTMGVAASGVAVSGILAACQVPAPPPQAANVTSAPTQESTTAPTSAPAAAGGTVKWAEFYSLLTDASGKLNQDWIAGVVKQFEDENAGWKVEREAIKWDQIDQKAILDLTAGVDHDLMFSSPQLMAKHLKADTYLDLTPWIEKMPKAEQDDLNWSPGWKSATVGGKQIGIATGVHTRTLAYNRDIFKAADLDPDKPLTTLDEMVEVAKKTTKADQDIWGLGMFLGNSRATIELYYAPIVWSFGGDFYDSAAQKATLTGDASIKAVQWIYDLVHTHQVTPPYSFASDADYNNLIMTAFTGGKLAQSMGYGSYWIGAMQEKNMTTGCFPATAECKVGTGGVMVQPGAARAQFTNAWCLSIHKLSKNSDAAWKLLQTIFKPENLRTYPDAGLPARLSAWESPEYSSDFYKIWLDAAKNGRPMPPTPYYPELADTMSAAMQEILSKKSDIPGTLKKFEDEWNSKYSGQ
ncbi:MAG: extracellular solute-binding protein [Chloroflexi bacterium]|nr:extracellular solute-binding protein [Chloroflexota bacterium]